MLAWLGLARALFGLLQSFADFWNNKQIQEGGKAIAERDNLAAKIEAIERDRIDEDTVIAIIDGEPIHTDDGFRRND